MVEQAVAPVSVPDSTEVPERIEPGDERTAVRPVARTVERAPLVPLVHNPEGSQIAWQMDPLHFRYLMTPLVVLS